VLGGHTSTKSLHASCESDLANSATIKGRGVTKESDCGSFGCGRFPACGAARDDAGTVYEIGRANIRHEFFGE
jgi:hypothetical protein